MGRRAGLCLADLKPIAGFSVASEEDGGGGGGGGGDDRGAVRVCLLEGEEGSWMAETKALPRCAPLSVIVAEMICPHTRSVWLLLGLLSGCSGSSVALGILPNVL